jgi:hypothetical protein
MSIRKEVLDAAAQLDVAMDADLVTHVHENLDRNLELHRQSGKSQWWNQKMCSVAALQSRLADAVNRHDYISAMTYAAMLHYLEQNS